MTTLTVLRLTVDLPGPWLVGDPSGLGDVDTSPLRDHDGTVQVPATSLAGSLRAHLERRSDLDAAAWMGELRDDDDRSGGPSRLRVLGVRLTGGERTVTRTSTAVNAHTGSALRKHLRREEYVDAPAQLIMYLTHSGEPHQPLLDGLTSWQPVIGRRRTLGWGRATLAELRHASVDLSDAAQLLAWLCGGGPEQIDQLVANSSALPICEESPAQDFVRVRFAVPVGVHIGTGSLDTDEPRATGDDGGQTTRVADIVSRDGRPYVPGSSWRGVLRGHTAFILRSLGCSDAAAQEAVTQVFGGPEQRGLLTFYDAPLRAAGDDAEPPRPAPTRTHEHIGIDRITGGARPGLLFGDRSAAGTVELRITADDPDSVPHWAASALGHAVRDLADGFLAIGGRTTRGLGTLELLDEPDSLTPAAAGVDISLLDPAAKEEPR